MTPKYIWIFRFIKAKCRQCGRCERIFMRLWEEIKEEDFDYEKDRKANQIISEEA